MIDTSVKIVPVEADLDIIERAFRDNRYDEGYGTKKAVYFTAVQSMPPYPPLTDEDIDSMFDTKDWNKHHRLDVYRAAIRAYEARLGVK